VGEFSRILGRGAVSWRVREVGVGDLDGTRPEWRSVCVGWSKGDLNAVLLAAVARREGPREGCKRRQGEADPGSGGWRGRPSKAE